MIRHRRLASLPAGIRTINPKSTSTLSKRTEPFYGTKEWKTFVADLVLRRGYHCEDPACNLNGGEPSRLFADHIHELQDGGAQFDPDNIMLRCGSCHTRKTVEQRNKRLTAPTSRV